MKSLREWVLESVGIYIGMKPTIQSQKEIMMIIGMNPIANAIKPDQLHTTIIYSRKYDRVNLIPLRYAQGVFSKLSLFGEDKNVLVMELSSESLVSEHEKIMREYDLTWDWDEYKPHITLSYNFTGNLNDIVIPEGFTIEFDLEYQEDLDLTKDYE
jgi:2'-5' RNA ligase